MSIKLIEHEGVKYIGIPKQDFIDKLCVTCCVRLGRELNPEYTQEILNKFIPPSHPFSFE